MIAGEEAEIKLPFIRYEYRDMTIEIKSSAIVKKMTEYN